MIYKTKVIVIKNKQPDAFETLANRFYHDNKVDYEALQYFIDNAYFPLYKKTWPVVTSFIPATEFDLVTTTILPTPGFHGDIYNHSDECVPVYTCLYYFDDATLEIIPHTHKQSFCIPLLPMLPIQAGTNSHSSRTFIMFNANIHHRESI